MSDPSSPTAPPTWRDRLDLIAGRTGTSPATVVVVAAGVAAAVLAGWFLLRQPPTAPPELGLPMAGASASTVTTALEEVVVHAAGAVKAPGVYRLPGGSRVTDVLDAAGGPTPEAELDRLNLAAKVVDGSQVYVPRHGEPLPAAATGGPTSAAPSGPLDLNTATVEQLDELPGVGPATAKAIVDERTTRGRFRSVEDLLDVRGIGPAKLEAIRDLVTV